jgi:hypothetical protein
MHRRVSRPELLSTYRYLRLAMPGLAALLAVSVALQVWGSDPDCELGSISASYYTPARAVFVACLCAIGTCLFVYRGTTNREEWVLNLSGLLAFFVAFIPTPLGEAKDGPARQCVVSNVPTADQLEDALSNNVTSALVALWLIAGAFVGFRALLKSGTGRPSLVAVGTSIVLAALATGAYVWAEDQVRDKGHYVAAFGLFIGVIVMALMHAWPRLAGAQPDGSTPQTATGYRIAYSAAIGVMVVALAVFGVLKLQEVDSALFWLESGLIIGFVFFWIAQTAENWKEEPSGAERP